MITWDNVGAVVLWILILWGGGGLVLALIIGAAAKLGGPEPEREPCCDGEFCGAWDSCKESSRLG